MSAVIGLEIGAISIRAVALSGFGRRTIHSAEAPWDGSDASPAIAALQRELGAASQIAVAIGLPFLHVSRVPLPAVAFRDRESMLALEPERYFATTEPVTTSLAPNSSVAFAANSAWLETLVRQLSIWGSVVRVEPVPVAIARGAGTAKEVHCEGGVVASTNGTVASVRRSFENSQSHETADRFSIARAAAHGVNASLDGTLMRTAERAAVTSRRWRSVAVAAVAAAAGIVFCGAAWDQSRDRLLAALEQQASQRAEEVRPALEAQETLMLRDQEAALLTARQNGRSRATETLAAISSVLPSDVVVLNARMLNVGQDWQIDGTARDAAALIPLFDKDARFDNVRTLAASTRFRDGNRTRESFSIALHVR